jgi:hypothetical protein
MAAERAADAVDPAGALLERHVTLRAVTVIMATVVGLTFMFGFGNVWTLALRLGVPPWVAHLASRFHEAGCPAGGQESRKCP